MGLLVAIVRNTAQSEVSKKGNQLAKKAKVNFRPDYTQISQHWHQKSVYILLIGALYSLLP